LAREIWGETKTKRGNKVARNRDRISAYEAERSKPSIENLEAIAKVFGMAVEDLAPDLSSDKAFADPVPAYEMRLVDGGAFIRVNAMVTAEVAIEIATILQKARIR